MLVGSTNYGEHSDRVALRVSYIIYLTVLSLPLLFPPKRAGLAHPLIFVVVAAIVSSVLRTGPIVWDGPDFNPAVSLTSDHDMCRLKIWELTMETLAMLACYGGYLLLQLRKVPVLQSAGNLSRARVVQALGFGVALAGILIYTGISGSLEIHLIRVMQGRGGLIGAYDTHISPVAILPEFAVASLAIWMAKEDRPWARPWFWLACTFTLSVAFLEGGRRSAIVYPSMLLLILYVLRTRQFVIGRPILLLIAIFALLGVSSSFREIAVKEATIDARQVQIVSNSIRSGWEELRMRSSTGGAAAIYANVPDNEPLMWGRSYLMNVLRFVPRAFWQSKPLGIDSLVGLTFFGYQVGKPPGGVAEAYWNFHVPGVIAVYILYGGFLGWLARFYRANKGNTVAIVVTAVSVVYFTPAQTSVTNWYFLLFPALILLALSGELKIRNWTTAR